MSLTRPRRKLRKARSLLLATAKRPKKGRFIPLDVKPGERVLLGRYSGTEINVDG